VWPERRLTGFRAREEGWANLVVEAEPGLVFRFPRYREVAEGVGYEVRVLEYLSEHLSVPIPTPLRVSILSRPRGWPFFCYARIPGTSLSGIPSLNSADRRKLGAFLARLLSELAFLSPHHLRRLGCPPGDRQSWEALYRRLLDRYYRVGRRRVPRAVDARLQAEFIQFFEDLRRSRYRPLLSHRDLGPYNILWDRRSRAPTGVLDWEDTRFGDPAFDLTGLGFLGARLVERLTALRREPADSTFEARLRFYRHVVPLHEMLHAIEHGKRELYRAKLVELRAGLGIELPR
jgi:aminoglycoside 2''-phosphotransferase